jgi:2-keto-myo-inositol isomerase
MAFTLCLNTSTIKPQPLLEKIRLAAEAGFAGIELWINDVYEYVGRGGEVRQVQQALRQWGLIVPCMIALRGWGEAEGPEYPLALEEARRRMELCARLGSPYVVATPPRGACDLGRLAERYYDLLEIGREVGVRPTFEYISFFRSAWKLEHAWQVVQQVNCDDATLILDAFHTWNSGSSLELLRQISASKISHYHIDDAARDKPPGTQSDPDRVMPGDGAIDLRSEIAVLRQIGYESTVSLELFNPQLWSEDPADVLQRGMQRLRDLLA